MKSEHPLAGDVPDELFAERARLCEQLDELEEKMAKLADVHLNAERIRRSGLTPKQRRDEDNAAILAKLRERASA